MTARTGRVAVYLAITVMLAGARPAAGQSSTVDPAKAELIRRLMTLTSATDLMVAAMEANVPAQREAMPQVPREFWDEFIARARRDVPRFIEMVIPIYDSQFSVAQLEELVAFYQTPLGRHVAQVQPVIATRSVQAGQRWGEQLGSEVAADLRKRGVELPQ